MSRSARESIINHFASSPRKNIDHVTKVRVVIDHVMSSQRKYRSHNEQPEKVGIDRLMSNIDHIERQELIKKLIDNGYEDIVNALLDDEKKVYTKKGRLNKSGACRKLKLKAKQLEDKLAEMRELLKKDIE